ncbi:uncharacterized protein LOC127263416 [Andrographis paniculata]|uniref:uncharacterized protein LOC127263416 n=1 Tax=Andrographis paniculata TaxID=175694 RepID=UPI0021E79E04|nr:uncharacterized protein LOC127263416 [Andrographis paniculata]
MLGTELQLKNTSGQGDDRFYSSARIRLIQEYLRGVQSDVTLNHSQSCSDESTLKKSKLEVLSFSPVSKPSPSCNLERFLLSVTPLVAAQYFPKMKAKIWKTGLEFQPFFVLSDLWDSFKEWSAYGVGVPLILNEHDCAVQFYVPYLSGIQLYSDLSTSTSKLRQHGEESDSEYLRDSSNDGSSDSEREGFSSDEGESRSSSGCLFEYLERDQPYCREPLANKIYNLAVSFPKLKTLRSCDLLPSSWLSVAWYPIYRIPTGPARRDLDACFLTYHSLHTPLTTGEATHTEGDGFPQLSLPVFGLASYKFKEKLWISNGDHHRQLARSLFQAADNWLNVVQVHHPDFSFFCRK